MARNRYAPLQSNKKEISRSNLNQNASTVQSVTIIQGVELADANAGFEVSAGHKVSSVYFELHFSAEVVAAAKVVHWQVVGLKVGETIAAPNTCYQDNRAGILKRGMEMLPRELGTVYKRVFVVKIPKKFQRITKNFLLRFQYIVSSTEGINTCGIGIYKDIS